MKTLDSFPLRGVIGVVSEALAEIKLAEKYQLRCVEIRADLLLDVGLTIDELMSGIGQAKQLGLACLFTLRHPDQGGRFDGTEQDRVLINQRALQAGADIIDLEWGTDASRHMLAEKAPVVLSYHDFAGMPDESELSTLTHNMLSEKPRAIKIVPTAASLTDAVRMLSWVSASDANDNVERIGFAMGESGACSRLLTTVFGGPVSYTSFGDPVAPGQIALVDMIEIYPVGELDNRTLVTAICGTADYIDATTMEMNRRYQQSQENRVAIGFPRLGVKELSELRSEMRIDKIVSENSV